MAEKLPSETRCAATASPGTGVLPVNAPVSYAELHCISNFTFLRGASFPEELVERADELGYQAIAITDECSLSGVVRAHMAAKERSIRLIIGSEFVLAEGCRLVLLAPNRKGYGELSHLISCARMGSKKGTYSIDRQMVEHNLPNDCLVLWIPELQQAPELIACQELNCYCEVMTTVNCSVYKSSVHNTISRSVPLAGCTCTM